MLGVPDGQVQCCQRQQQLERVCTASQGALDTAVRCSKATPDDQASSLRCPKVRTSKSVVTAARSRGCNARAAAWRARCGR
eukprot:3959495-Pleurochrysis_carterae.AAC.1